MYSNYLILKVQVPGCPNHGYCRFILVGIKHVYSLLLLQKNAKKKKKAKNCYCCRKCYYHCWENDEVSRKKNDEMVREMWHQEQMIFKPINELIGPTNSLAEKIHWYHKKVPQNVCLSFVLCSWAKEVSNYTIIEFYEKHITHLCKYQENCSHLEVDKQVVSKFLGAQLKKNNISKVQQALASSCKQSQSSSLNPLQYKLFMEKLNGSFARTTAKDLIINASVSLREIQDSSMNKEKLPVEFISIIDELKLHNKATCSWSFVHSHFLCKNLNAICADYLIIFRDLFRIFCATFFKSRLQKIT